MPQREAQEPAGRPHAAGPRRRGQASRAGERRRRGQADEAGAASPAAVWGPEEAGLGQGGGNPTSPLHGDGVSARPTTSGPRVKA